MFDDRPDAQSPFIINQNFVYDIERKELLKNGQPFADIGGKTLNVLEVLVRAEGGIVNHEEFIAKVWNNNFFVGKKGIIREIYKLRCVIEENPKSPKNIVSSYGEGYYLKTTIERTNRTLGEEIYTRTNYRFLIIFPVILGMLLTGNYFFKDKDLQLILSKEILKETSDTKQLRYSNDGHKISFLMKENNNWNIYIGDVEHAKEVPITQGGDLKSHALWGKGDNFLYYLKSSVIDNLTCQVIEFDLLTRKERVLSHCFEMHNSDGEMYSLDINSERTSLLFISSSDTQPYSDFGIYEYHIDSDEKRLIIPQREQAYIYSQPTYGYSEHEILFSNVNNYGAAQVESYDLNRKTFTQYPSVAYRIRGLLPVDNERILFSSGNAGKYRLFNINKGNSKVKKIITQNANSLTYPSLSSPSEIAYTETIFLTDVLKLSIANTDSIWERVSQPNNSVSVYKTEKYSFYIVNESGIFELWRKKVSGGEVTYVDRLLNSDLSITSKEIYYLASQQNGPNQIKVLELASGKSRVLVEEGQSKMDHFLALRYNHCNQTLLLSGIPTGAIDNHELGGYFLWEYNFLSNQFKKIAEIDAVKLRLKEDCSSVIFTSAIETGIRELNLESSKVKVLFSKLNPMNRYLWDYEDMQLFLFNEGAIWQLKDEKIIHYQNFPADVYLQGGLTLSNGHVYLTSLVESSGLYKSKLFK